MGRFIELISAMDIKLTRPLFVSMRATGGHSHSGAGPFPPHRVVLCRSSGLVCRAGGAFMVPCPVLDIARSGSPDVPLTGAVRPHVRQRQPSTTGGGLTHLCLRDDTHACSASNSERNASRMRSSSDPRPPPRRSLRTARNSSAIPPDSELAPIRTFTCSRGGISVKVLRSLADGCQSPKSSSTSRSSRRRRRNSISSFRTPFFATRTIISSGPIVKTVPTKHVETNTTAAGRMPISAASSAIAATTKTAYTTKGTASANRFLIATLFPR